MSECNHIYDETDRCFECDAPRPKASNESPGWERDIAKLVIEGNKCELWGRKVADMDRDGLIGFIGFLDELATDRMETLQARSFSVEFDCICGRRQQFNYIDREAGRQKVSAFYPCAECGAIIDYSVGIEKK